MRELGEHSGALHAGLAPAVLDAHVDRLILIGDEMRPLAEKVVGKVSFDLADSVDEATEALIADVPSRATRCSSRRPTRSDLRSSSSAVAKGPRMLYVIAEQLGFPGVLNLIRYISFRAGAASATALADRPPARAVVHLLAARDAGQGPADPRRRAAEPPRQARHADDGRAADPDLGRRSRSCCGWTSPTLTSGRACWSRRASG